MRSHHRIGLLSLLALSLAACDGGKSSTKRIDGGADVGVADAVVHDAAPTDAATMDGSVADAAPPDAQVTPDAEPFPDAAPIDEPLTLNSIVPNRGVIEGGTPVRIVGTGFAPGVEFRFGNDPCQNVVVETHNRATCVTPAHAVGAVDLLAILEVQHLNGPERRQDLLAGAFTYYEGVTLTALEPNRSPVRGGIEVALRGTGLIDGTRVDIGHHRAEDVHLRADGTLSARVPAGDAPGPADVTVTNPNGSATLAGGLFYFEDLSLQSLDPPVGPLAGGNRVALLGSGLTAGTTVTFGDQMTAVVSASDDRTRLEVDAPRGHAAGPVDVKVANDNGEFTLPGGYVYYDDAAMGFGVVGLAPASGPVEGGNTVFVTGAGFTAQTAVSLDGREVQCQFVDAHQLRCTMPPGEVGPADVTVSEGGQDVQLPYTYFQQLTLIAIEPDHGAVAGGTKVRLTGSGFVPGMTIALGGQPLQDLEIVDETTATGTTPPNTPGPVDVLASTPLTRSVLGGGYTYFDPVSAFGGLWGDPIDGAVNVTVLNAANGMPLSEVAVLALGDDGALSIEGQTNEVGQVTLSDFDMHAPLVVTAAKEGFEVTTIKDVEVENVTIYLQPNDGMGDPPPGVPAAMLRGTATGLDRLPKPDRENVVNVLLIETTHPTPYDRNQLPPPGPGGMLTEDGPFEIIARPGELAIIATAGELDRDALKAFQDGNIDYWTMRQSFSPVAMGIHRFVSASPGQELDGLDVTVDHPMDLTIPVTLDNPPLGADPGPSFYAVLPRLNFGSEGFWEIDSQAVALDPNLTLGSMPRLDGWDPDITYYLLGLGFSSTPDNTPMAVTIEETRDVAAGVFITPFVGTARFQHPLDGQSLGENRHVSWSVDPGFDGPIHPPAGNLVLVEEPQLGPPKPLWRYVTPSLVTEFDFPVLPQAAGAAGLGGGVMFLTVLPFVVDGDFNYDDFTYDQLAQLRWKGWSVSTITFQQ